MCPRVSGESIGQQWPAAESGTLNTTVHAEDLLKEVSIIFIQFSSVTQLCPTLCNPMSCSPPGSSVHGDSPGKDARAGCHALLQGTFPTQGSNPGILKYRQILYRLSHQGSPTYTPSAITNANNVRFYFFFSDHYSFYFSSFLVN